MKRAQNSIKANMFPTKIRFTFVEIQTFLKYLSFSFSISQTLDLTLELSVLFIIA